MSFSSEGVPCLTRAERGQLDWLMVELHSRVEDLDGWIPEVLWSSFTDLEVAVQLLSRAVGRIELEMQSDVPTTGASDPGAMAPDRGVKR